MFALGPKTSEEKDLADARSQLGRQLAKVPEVRPATVAVFGGVIDPEKLTFPFSRLPESDARDWVAVETWTGEVAAAVGVE